jgi:hypothetical protein
MNNELMLAVLGQKPVRRADKAQVKRAEELIRQVQMAKLKKDGMAAFTADMMDDIRALGSKLASMLTGDAVTDRMLARALMGFVDDAAKLRSEMYR